MHDSMARLYEAAKAIKDVEGQTALAKLLGHSPQVVNNWEARGISAEGALKAQERIGCDANWVMRGVGEMLPAWPFPKVPLERFLALEPDDRGYVQRKLMQAIEECGAADFHQASLRSNTDEQENSAYSGEARSAGKNGLSVVKRASGRIPTPALDREDARHRGDGKYDDERGSDRVAAKPAKNPRGHK